MKLRRWTNDEIDFLKENYNSMDCKKLSNLLNRSESAIQAKASNLKITNKNEWTKEEIDYLKSNYKSKTYKELSDELPGRTKTSIDLKLSRLGLVKSKYKYNHDFFENIDTEEKAYWLGFFYADGCVSKDGKRRGGECCIKLNKNDYTHLKKFNKSINGNIPVTFSENICSFNNKKQYSCSIRCYSVKMAKDLIAHGCIPNKTFVIKMPIIDEPLINHFIRGFFDGDGCICTNNKTRQDLNINFCSASQDFLLSLRDILYKNNIFSYITDEKDKNTYRLYIKGLKNVDNMWKYMFDNATIYLDRKYEKKKNLYEKYQIAQRLLRLSEMAS